MGQRSSKDHVHRSHKAQRVRRPLTESSITKAEASTTASQQPPSLSHLFRTHTAPQTVSSRPLSATMSVNSSRTPSSVDHSYLREQERSSTGQPRYIHRQISSSSAGPSSGSLKQASLEKFFQKYKDNFEDAILAEGMERFCQDLGVEPTEFIVLVLAWRFQALEMCRFTREEFLNGCRRVRAHDLRSLRQRFPELIEETRSEKNFKDLYQFTFSFGLDHASGQRALPVDMAIALWELAFSQNPPVILKQWFEFLQSSEVRGISRDTWNMFLPFILTVAPDLSDYDDCEAWPSLFDDFVESELEKMSK